MGPESIVYRVLLLLYLAALVVGFGGLITNSLYHGRAAKRPVRAAAEVLRSAAALDKYAHYGLYALLPLGLCIVAVSNGTIGFGELWVWLSMLIWMIAVGANLVFVRPAVNALLAIAESWSPSLDLRAKVPATGYSGQGGGLSKATTLEEVEKTRTQFVRLAFGEATTQILMAVALILMVWQPGQP